MKIKKAFSLSLNMLVHSKVRSWLTIIGVVIGIAAVVSIISVSQGAQKNLQSQLSSLGADVLTVSPGLSRASGAAGNFRFGGGGGGDRASTSTQKNLTSKDINVIRGTSGVMYVMGTVNGRAPVTYISKSSTVNIVGVDPSVWNYFNTATLAQGRFLSKGDTDSVVVGSRVANSTFGGMEINRQVDINGKIFRIVGILKETGTNDNNIFMPVILARDVLDTVGTGSDSFGSISVKINNVDLTDSIVSDITGRLLLSRGVIQSKNQDFSVSSPKAFQATVTSTLNSISLFLAAIAAISLIVGAVGIANTMFTSVLEKTRDIGIMKAIGAQNKDILMIFLLNSGLLGLVGGVGGIIIGVFAAGFIGSLAGGSIGRLSFSSTYFSPGLIIGVFLLSIVVGMIAGAIPAYRASRLRPVEALRSD